MTKTVYLPPYLVDKRTGEAHFFNLEMAKNPYLDPAWTPPEGLFAHLSDNEAAAAHLRACDAITRLHVTAMRLLDINNVRAMTAENFKLLPETVAEIGVPPNDRRLRRAVGDGQALRPITLIEPDERVVPQATGDVTILSSSEAGSGTVVSNESRRRRLASAASAF